MVKLFKKLIFFESGGYPQAMSKYLSVKYLICTDIKKTGTQSSAVQKIDTWKVYKGVVPPNYVKIFVC